MAFSSSDVRRELGDPSTDTLTGTTLSAIVDEETSLEAAAAHAAEILSRKFALKADRSMGGVSLEYQARAERWQTIAQDLDGQAVEEIPVAGSLSTDFFFSRDIFTEDWDVNS